MVQAFPDGGTLRSNRLLHRMAIRSHPAVPGGRRKGHKTGLNFRWGDWWGLCWISGVWWGYMEEIRELEILEFSGEIQPVFRRRTGLPSISCPACAGGDLNPHASRLTHLKRNIYRRWLRFLVGRFVGNLPKSPSPTVLL